MKSRILFLGVVGAFVMTGCYNNENLILKNSTIQLPLGYMVISGISYKSGSEMKNSMEEINFEKVTPGFYVVKSSCDYELLRSYKDDSERWNNIGFIPTSEAVRGSENIALYDENVKGAHRVCIETDSFGETTINLGVGESRKDYEKDGKYEDEIKKVLLFAQDMVIEKLNE